MAALCVGLIALLYVEAAHADGHTDLNSESVIYAAAGQVVHTHEEAGHEHDSGGAEHDGSQPHAHYCSMAHTAASPSGGVQLGYEQRALKAHPMREAAWRLTSRLYGLERPPRG